MGNVLQTNKNVQEKFERARGEKKGKVKGIVTHSKASLAKGGANRRGSEG